MALKDKIVSLRFLRGIDTESDDKTLEPGTPTEVRDGVYKKRVTIEKRFGTERLSRRVLAPDGTYASLSGALGLSSRRDGEELVMMTTSDSIVTYDEADGSWVDRGDWVPLRHDVIGLPRGTNERWDGTTAAIGDVRLVAWQDARDGIHAQFMGLDGPPTYGRDFRVGGALGRQPRIVPIDNSVFLLFFTSGTELHVAPLAASRPASTTFTTVQIRTDLSSSVSVGSCPYDACSHPTWNTARVAASIAGNTWVAVIRSNGIIGSSGSSQPWPHPVLIPRSDAGPAIAPSMDGLAFGVGYKSSAGTAGTYDVRVLATNTLLPLAIDGVSSGSVTLDSDPTVKASGQSVLRHTISFGSGSTNPIHLWLTMSGALESDRHVRHASAHSTTTLLAVSSGTLRRHSQLNSRAFNVAGTSYAWVNRPSLVQSTDFLYREDGLPIARTRAVLSVPNVSGTLPSVDVVRGRVPYRATTNRESTSLNPFSGSQFSGRHVVLDRTEVHATGSWVPVDVGGLMHFGGGWVGTYDGDTVCEMGFSELIDSISGSIGSASLGRDGIQRSQDVLAQTGPLATASLLYAVVPYRFDALGNQWQGGYARVLTLPMSASTTQVQNTASITWPTMAHTMRDGTRAPYDLFAVYRSAPGGTVFQRIDDPAFPIANSTSSDYVTFNDTVSEASRQLGEQAYTVTENMNVLPSTARLLASTGDRLFMAGVEDDPNGVIASKLRDGGAPQFAIGGGFSCDESGGPVTVLTNLDADLLVFKRSRVMAVSSNGPDNDIGNQTPWPIPTTITSDVGCSEQAVAFPVAGRTEQGIVFHSDRGVRMIDRGGAVKDIGSPAAGYDSLDAVAGLAPRLSEEARVYTTEGTQVVFNTRFDTWSTFTGHPAVAATLWKGRPTYVAPDGFTYAEDSGSFRDGDSPYPLSITLGWMAFEGLQGVQRVRQAYLLGDFKSPHSIRLEMAYDYRDSWVRAPLVSTTTALGVVPYGGPPGYGSGSFGGQDPVYQLRFDMPIQRCQSIRFRISDTAQSGSADSFSLTEMKLLLAIESSRPRLPVRKVR